MQTKRAIRRILVLDDDAFILKTISHALGRLGYAQVVTLALEGLGYGDIADVLGITESNVGARLTRADRGAVGLRDLSGATVVDLKGE